MIYHDTTAIDAVNKGQDTPDAFYHKSTLIATSKYIATDGWRGYTEIIPQPGYKEIEADWMTGDWDDAIAAEHGETPTEAKIKALETEHGDIYVVYTPTSNVFSTSYNVLVKDPDVKPVRGKTIAHKTKLFTESDGSWRVQYHATNVVKYNPAKQPHYTLDTGGWNTMTTSKRMTEALPAGWYVYRKNWIMYLHRTGCDDIEIKDGMEV